MGQLSRWNRETFNEEPEEPSQPVDEPIKYDEGVKSTIDMVNQFLQSNKGAITNNSQIQQNNNKKLSVRFEPPVIKK